METLSNLLKNQLPDYVNIEALISKLEGSTFDRIHDLIQTVFSDTAIAILEELAERNEQPPEVKNVQPYYESNLMLFKNKFVMIMQMMIENVFGKTLLKVKSSKKAEKKTVKEKIAQETTKMEDKKSSASNEIRKTPRISTTPLKQRKEPNEKQKAVKEISYVLRPSRTPTKKVASRENSLTKTAPTRKRLSIKLDGSQFYDSRNDSRIVRTTKMQNITQDNPSLEKSSTELHTTCSQTRIEMTTPSSPLTLMPAKQLSSTSSLQPVQSEFNHVRGPVSFTISKKQLLEVKSETPGPGSYQPKPRKVSPNTVINRAPKPSWVDEAVFRSDSPGPAAHDARLSNNSPSCVIGEAKRTCWVDEVAARSESPGPAAYEPEIRSGSPNISIGKAQKKSWIDQVARTDSPGPARYTPSPRSNSPSLSFGKSPKVCWVDQVSQTDSPGPAKYGQRSRSNSPNPTIGKAKVPFWIDAEIARTDSPGPAAYYPSKHFVSK